MNTQKASPKSTLVSRRSLLFTGGAGALATLSLAACGGDDASDAENGEAATPNPDRPLEAPMLTEQVEAGDLPPLEERLPVDEDQLVVETPEFGDFGGTYSGAVTSPNDNAWMRRLIAFEPTLRPSPDLTEAGLPGTLKEVQANENGTEYTLYLREGLRWSDGELVTADDVMFAIEDVYFNDELYPDAPAILEVNGEPCTAERLDDYTVHLTFPGPKGDFIEHASRQAEDNGNLLYFPKHYLEQYLPHLNEEAEAAASDAGYDDWTGYWETRLEWHNNPDRPTLNAWLVTSALNEGGTITAERNPYYWKVDAEGAQLPFLDYLNFEMVLDEEVLLLNAMNGELDFHARHFNQDANRPVLAEARDDGDFDFVTVGTTSMNHMVIALNLNHSDDELREIFNTKDFRIGLSYAIDRQEIIDTVYQRQGEPWQTAPRPDSEYYDEEFAKQYTEYDVHLANESLDAAGLTERDRDGFRLRPDGDRIRFNVDVSAGGTERIEGMNLIVQYWEEVGIDAQVNTIERSLFYDRKTAAANEHDANVWGGDGGLRVEMLDTRWWFPSTSESNFAPRWAYWYETRGEGEFAEEPPEAPSQQMELMRQILADPDTETQEAHFREILNIAKEEFYTIGVTLPGDEYGIAKNDVGNIVDYVNTSQYDSPGHVNPPTWYFDE